MGNCRRRAATLAPALGTLLLLAPGVVVAARAQTQVQPDRPDVTNGTQTVPVGAFQIETGLEYARTSASTEPARRRFAVQGTLRAGLTDRLEVRLDGEPLVDLGGAERDVNRGDLALGVKYRFLDAAEGQWRPSLGAQVFVKLPTAAAPIGSERADAAALALASFELPWRLSLDVNAGLAAIAQTRPDSYLLQELASASLSIALTERLSVLVELFFASRAEHDGRDSLGLDVGGIYLVTNRIALDVGAGTTLTGRGPDYVVRGGASIRFGR